MNNNHMPLSDDSYEQDYQNIKDQFQKKVHKFNIQPDSSLVKDMKRDLEDVQNTMRLIEQELNSTPSDSKNLQKNKIKKYRDEVEKMKRQMKEVEQHGEDMNNLVGNPTEKRGNNNSSQGNGAFQKLQEQNRKMIDAKRNAYDIEEQSNQIGYEVNKQNQQLTGMIRSNSEITHELGLSNKLLDTIHRNIVKKRAVMYAVIAFLFICLLVIVLNWF